MAVRSSTEIAYEMKMALRKRIKGDISDRSQENCREARWKRMKGETTATARSQRKNARKRTKICLVWDHAPFASSFTSSETTYSLHFGGLSLWDIGTFGTVQLHNQLISI